MDLSQPHIAIRERTMLEIFDLTLHVYRDHWWNILILLAINALPLTIVDFLVIHFLNTDGRALPSEQLWLVLILIVSQSQIGTLLITQYLGTAMFSGRPSVGATIKRFFTTSLYWIWSHGFVRMAIPVFYLLGFADYHWAACAWVLLMFALLVRAIRPFISEVLILEKPPVKPDKTDPLAIQITLKQRSSDLHRGDVLAGFFMSTLIGGCLTVAIASLFFHIDSAIGLNGAWDSSINYAYWPLALWLTASFLAVFRFLYYINTRITQEGWEIVLKLMAEKQNLLAEDHY